MVALMQSAPEVESCEDADVRVEERRIFGRRRVNVQATARRLDHSLSARRNPRVQLEVQDVSLSGVSAVSAYPLHMGEFLCVSLPPDLGQRGWQAFGRVIRCEMGVGGYHVGVEFDSLPAA